MTNKWIRNYIVQVMGNDGQIHEIDYPLTMEFSVTRECYASASIGNFRLFNLGEKTRNAIFKDQFDNTVFRSLKVMAGYGQPPLPIIFNGNVKQCYSWREEGSVDYITEIQGYDYGLIMSTDVMTQTWQAGQGAPNPLTQVYLLTQLCNHLIGSISGSGLAIGLISPSFTKTYPDYSVAGNTWDAITAMVGTDGYAYIDNGRIFIIKESDVFQGDILEISSATGLLGTPKRAGNYVEVEVLFEPKLLVGQQINLISASGPIGTGSTAFGNGLHKVLGVSHKGVISGAVNGKCKTTASLLLPPLGFNILNANVNV